MIKSFPTFLVIAVFVYSASSAQTRIENCAKAKILYDSAQYKQERKFLNTCLRNDDYFSEYYYLRAECNFEDGNINDAFDDIDRAINLAYDSLKYRFTKADFYQDAMVYNSIFHKSDFVIEFDKELELIQQSFPIAKNAVDSATLYDYSGLTREELGDTAGGIRDLEKAVSLNSAYPEWWLDLSALYDDIDSISLSMDYAKKALSLDSTLPNAYLSVGESYLSMEKFNDAIIYLDKGLALDSTDNRLFDSRGYAEMEMGDSLGALQDFEKSIKIRDDNALTYYDLAQLYDKMGEEKKACATIDKALYWGYTEYYGNGALDLKEKICGH